MRELGALYDSSFPDTDPFEPQPGGCCSIFPFFLGDLVELPITLPQDHTLWEILRKDSIEHWTRKSDWIVANGGMINLITHPDYLDTPREVAAWWRTRAGLSCIEEGDEAWIEGAGAERARLVWAVRSGDGVALELDPVAE
jgi:hypothetical protein